MPLRRPPSRQISTLVLALALALWGCKPVDIRAAAQGISDAAQGVQRVPLAGGRRLALRCSGAGAPTVILESGYAGDSGAWYKVQPVVAKTTRVCSYDRAGYGLSDPGPEPRDGAATARDLDEALKVAGIKGPFVLVGHSAGGIYVRLFAARRLAEVKGMVLVDPSVEHQDRRFAAVFGPGAGNLDGQKARAVRCIRANQTAGAAKENPEFAGCFAKDGSLIPASVWKTQFSEAETLWGATSDQADRIGDLLLDIPVIVLTAKDGYLTPSGAYSPALAVWEQLHGEIAAHSVDGVVRDVASGHMMMFEKPEAITGAIAEMVTKVRAGAPR